MKKLILTIAMALIATTAFASATLKQTIKVTPDTLIDNAVPGSFVSDKITLNAEYMTAVGVFDGSSTVTIRFIQGGFSGRLCPALTLDEYGKFGTVAYKVINDSHKSWVRNNSSSADAVTLDANGAVLNAKYLSRVTKYETVSIKSTQSACGTSGLYPAWKFTVDIVVPKAVYEAQVKPAIDAWELKNIVTFSSATTQ